MKVLDFCKNYFSGFQDLYHFKKNDKTTNVLAVLKVLSCLTAIIPLGIAAVYGAALLYGRVTKKQEYSPVENQTKNKANEILGNKTPPKVTTKVDLSALGDIELSEVLSTYRPLYAPLANKANLLKYSESKDYIRHANTARIYYNSNQLEEEDALRIAFQREPTNIAMGSNQYDQEKLGELFGYRKGVYNDKSAKKKDGTFFRELPNTAAIYSETYLWNPPGGPNKKEIACLSLPAPALDSDKQPHYSYYVQNGRLNAKKYDQEMEFLFRCIEKTIRDNKESAFGNKGIKRIVLSKFGLGAFLGGLTEESGDRDIARSLYKKQRDLFLNRIKGLNLEIVTSVLFPSNNEGMKTIVGDIIKNMEEHDLVINAWDPHSAAGNGNDGDASFDGAMGKSSGILLTQTAWLNKKLRSNDSLVSVN